MQYELEMSKHAVNQSSTEVSRLQLWYSRWEPTLIDQCGERQMPLIVPILIPGGLESAYEYRNMHLGDGIVIADLKGGELK
jgi:hypothetical protein